MCGTYIGYRRYLRESSINHGLIQFVPFLFLRLRSLAEAMSDVMHRGEKEGEGGEGKEVCVCFGIG